MRRAVRFGLLPVIVLVVVAAAGSGVYHAVAPRLAAALWDLDIDRAMDAAGVAPGMIVGEAGAGDGYFTLPMARRVGSAGAVYANDISRRALDSLEANAKRERLPNVHTVEGTVDDPLFPQPALDMAVMVYALHDFAHPAAFLNSLKRYLKPGGTVVILDQNPEASGDRHFLSRERLVELFHESGYELMADERFLERDLLLVFRPS